jgi:uncharacterized protein (DUF58 family)
VSGTSPDTRAALRSLLDWGKLGPLRIRARRVADGVYAGGHRSPRRGPGVEFGGHRAYVPGDDLRWLDRRALMRHGRLLVRQFETETDRALRLIVDASASMGYRSRGAPGAKLAYAAVLAAALARIALAGGDPVALDWIGGENRHPLPALGGREAFERVVAALESVQPGGDLTMDASSIERAFAAVARHARRGSVIVLFSDLIDLPEATLDRFAALATLGRTLVTVRVLDPVEESFSLDGPLRLRATEGDVVVETDAAQAREGYLEALEAIRKTWEDRMTGAGGEDRMTGAGGRLVTTNTSADPVAAVREIVLGVRGSGA